MKKIAIFVDGGNKLGMGNFSRVLPVALYLRQNNLAEVSFVVVDKLLEQKLKPIGFEVLKYEGKSVTELKDEISNLKNKGFDKVLIDVRNDYNVSNLVKHIKKHITCPVIAIGVQDDSRLLMDCVIYPLPKKLIEELYWNKYEGKVLASIKFLPVRQEFFDIKPTKKIDKIVVSMGGSDPHDIVMKVMKYLSDGGYKIKIIIGPGFANKDKVDAFAAQHKDVFRIISSPKNIAREVADASLVITASGISVYEFSILKKPLIVIGHYPLNSVNCRKLEKLGYCRYLGLFNEFSKDDLVEAVQNPPKFVLKKSELPDERGAQRIAEAVLDE